MAFNWREYLEIARWLQGNTIPGVSEEAAQRCAVSRAYYAAFCYARNYARDYMSFLPRYAAEDHGRLRAHLKIKRWKTAQCLDRLRDWRNDCDYQDDYPGDLARTLAEALNEAEYVFTSLQPPTSSTGP